jgi:peptidoglycan/xylan/chitin deacetylase (PgdA/CDA1 family)
MSGVILMYHRVAQLQPDTHKLCVAPARFREQLKKIARPMTLEEVARGGDGTAVTLDDGTLDALAAADLLDEVGVPATFFVGGDRLDVAHESWWDTLERIFLDGARIPDQFGDLPSAEAHPVLRARLLGLGAAAQAALLDEICAWSGLDLPPRESHRLLLRGELRALAARHDIGAHGLLHLHLPSLPRDEQHAELLQSRATLESALGRPITRLAYAYGAADDAVVQLAGELGFTCAVTTAGRAVEPGDVPLRLPRVDARMLE